MQIQSLQNVLDQVSTLCNDQPLNTWPHVTHPDLAPCPASLRQLSIDPSMLEAVFLPSEGSIPPSVIPPLFT